jgi:hypothetical protein
VESVKALSYFDLLTALTNNEELMLMNARHSVPDTLAVLIRVHEKRLPQLKDNVDLWVEGIANEQDAWEQHRTLAEERDPVTGTFRLQTQEEHAASMQKLNQELGVSKDALHRCQRSITAMKTLLRKLENPTHATS